MSKTLHTSDQMLELEDDREEGEAGWERWPDLDEGGGFGRRLTSGSSTAPLLCSWRKEEKKKVCEVAYPSPGNER